MFIEYPVHTSSIFKPPPPPIDPSEANNRHELNARDDRVFDGPTLIGGGTGVLTNSLNVPSDAKVGFRVKLNSFCFFTRALFLRRRRVFWFQFC